MLPSYQAQLTLLEDKVDTSTSSCPRGSQTFSMHTLFSKSIEHRADAKKYIFLKLVISGSCLGAVGICFRACFFKNEKNSVVTLENICF